MAGLNVTLPFKGEALALADEASFRARAAQAANVLVFREDGTILADNTDGLGMLVGQGVIGLKYWTGIDADAAVMRQALLDLGL